MAGLGRCCSHAGALMWKIEYAVHENLTGASCTDEQAAWNRGTTKNITPSAIVNIPFKKPKRHNAPMPSIKKPANPTFPQYESQKQFLEAVEQSDIKDLFKLPNSTIGKSVRAEVTSMSRPDQDFKHEQHTGQQGDCTLCSKFFHQYIDLPTEQLEEHTKEQSNSNVWRDSRRVRLTASTANKFQNVPLQTQINS